MPELTAAARAGARASARKPLSASAPLLLGLALHPGAAGVLEVHSLPLGVPIRGVPTTQCSPPDPEGKPAMYKWLSPQKTLDRRHYGQCAAAARPKRR